MPEMYAHIRMYARAYVGNVRAHFPETLLEINARARLTEKEQDGKKSAKSVQTFKSQCERKFVRWKANNLNESSGMVVFTLNVSCAINAHGTFFLDLNVSCMYCFEQCM